MSYLSLLTDDEVRYICSVIPHEHTIAYFQMNPKELAKIRPGFRAKAISKYDAEILLFQNRNKSFVANYIEKHINEWVSQVNKHIDKLIVDGDSKNCAVLKTLPFSFFAGNAKLYFKLSDVEYSEDFITMLSSTINIIKESSDKQKNIYEELKDKESDIKKIQIDFEAVKLNLDRTRTKLKDHVIENKSLKRVIADLEKQKIAMQTDHDAAELDLERSNNKLNECLAEIKSLKQSLASFVKQKIVVEKNSQLITALNAEIQERDKTIYDLRYELSGAKNIIPQLEEEIRKEYEKKQAAQVAEQQYLMKLRHPRDIDEFKDCLGYNFENIGVQKNSEYYYLLKEHLGSILFQGIPIVVNRGTVANLSKCVANTLIGRSKVKTLAFRQDTSLGEIEGFLSSAGRVVCLDNFISNYNETELLPLFDQHRNIIIFLTVAYERSLNYVSYEFFRYCHYININRITAFSTNMELTEDPTTIEEEIIESQNSTPNERYSLYLREILRELGFNQSLVEQKCTTISDERDLCCFLAFDILPYCTDVLRIDPFQMSERLLKYAGDSGRCPYKKLLKEWFRQ